MPSAVDGLWVLVAERDGLPALHHPDGPMSYRRARQRAWLWSRRTNASRIRLIRVR